MGRLVCPTLVGRQGERHRLEGQIERALAGRGGVALVSGPAGIGKSRLVAAAAHRAEEMGARVLLGRAVPSSVPIPYRPFTEALFELSRAGPTVALSDLRGFDSALRLLLPGVPRQALEAVDASPLVVAEALLRLLQHQAGLGATLLVLEDLHWADPETLDALEYLADHASASRLACIATVRDEPNVPALDLAARLEARGCLELVRLPPLRDEEVEAMACATLEVAHLPDDLRSALLHGADGVPLLAEEVLADVVASGVLVKGGHGWQLTRPLLLTAPRTFRDRVRARWAELNADGRRAVGIAAILGRRFDWRLAVRAAALDQSTGAAAMREGVDRQLLTPEGGGFVFRHSLTREAVLDLLLPSERSLLAGLALAELERTSTAGDDWRHLAADLAELAGQPDCAASHLFQAAHASLRRGALGTASAALEHAVRLASGYTLRADVLELLAEARSAAGDLAGAQTSASALLESLDTLPPDPERRARTHLSVARAAIAATHFAVASEELARVRRLNESPGSPRIAAQATAAAAQLAIGEGRIGEARSLAARALEEASTTHQPEVMCEALEVAGRCVRTRDLAEAAPLFARGEQLAEEAGLPLWRLRALYQAGTLDLLRTGDIRQLERARALAEHLGAVATMATLDLEIGAGLEMQHRSDEALAVLGRCVELASILRLRLVEGMAHTFIAVVEGVRGARSRMEAASNQALALAAGDPDILGAIWGDARAVASLAAEDRARAIQELQAATAAYAGRPAASPRPSLALWALLTVLSDGEVDLKAISDAMGQVCQSRGYLAYAEAITLGRAGRTAEATTAAARGDLALLLAPWYRHLVHRLAAEAALADGWGDPRAWLREAATYFDAAGDARLRSACLALLRRAGEHLPRTTRATRSLPGRLRAAGVTAREAEVLALVGEGHSNADIAARLFLSERTVEHHVGSLRAKLGLESRGQMVAFAITTSRN